MLESEGEVTTGFDYNTDQTYVAELQYSDLGIDTHVFNGMKVAGAGIIISIMIIGLLRLLRQ